MVIAMVGCGLSFSADPAGAPPVTPEEDGAPPPRPDAQPPTGDAEVPDTSPPTPTLPIVYTLSGETPIAVQNVYGLALDPMGALVAISHDTTSIVGYDVATAAERFSFPSASAPSSFLALATGGPISAVYALPGNGGLFAQLPPDGPRVYGARTEAARVFGRAGHVYTATGLNTALPGGTKIVACGATFPATENACDAPSTAYDSAELAGFAVSPNDLLLAGITGGGDTALLSLYSRASTATTFATPVKITVGAFVTAGAVEIFEIDDEGKKVRFRAPCRATTDPVCVYTLTGAL